MFEGKFVKLKALEQNDLACIRQWKRPINQTIASVEYEMLDTIHKKNWLQTINSSYPPKEIVFGVVNKKNTLIGLTALTHIDWKNRNSKILVYLHTKYLQRTKEADESVTILLKYGFGELNLHRLYVELMSFATASIKLFQRLKFINEGEFKEKSWKNGKWWNTVVYSKLSTEYVYD